MNFNTRVTANGMTGMKSHADPNSRLSKLVFYLKSQQRNGGTGTKMGFARALGKPNGSKTFSDLFQMAAKTGIIVISKERHNRSTILELGPNASRVTTLEV